MFELPAACCSPLPLPLCLTPPMHSQVVGFVVLLSGTSVYNEIMRSCLPAAEPRRRSRSHRSRATTDAEAGLSAPLLGEGDFGAGSAEEQQQQGKAGDGGPGVRFAPMPPSSRPIAAGRASDTHARYTMARCVLVVTVGCRGRCAEVCLARS